MTCWDKDPSVKNPKIREFKSVKRISGGGKNKRRRLSDGRRRLSDSTFEFMCIQSDVDVSRCLGCKILNHSSHNILTLVV